MRWLPWAMALAFLATPVLAAEPDGWDVIRVTAGAQKDFRPKAPVRRVAVGDAAIADVSVLNQREILVLGKKTGVTSLLLWERKGGEPKVYQIQVDQPLPGKTPVSEAAGHLTSEGAPVILHGEMKDALHHQMAYRMAQQAADKGVVLDRSTIPVSGQVMVDVRFVEISKKVLKQSGFNLISQPQHSISFGVWAPGSLSQLTRTGSTISTDAAVPMLSAMHLMLGSTSGSALGLLALLENNGLARTLAQPSMTVVSGQTASFMAGGEYPIPVGQSLGQVTVDYKRYGIQLALTPTVFSKDRIALKLAPEVSELDFANAVTLSGLSVPAILTRRADTTIELGDGESFVIAGLISRSFSDAVDKVPGLGDVPILGAFFKSTHFSREDKELVIIATPRLVQPIAAKAELPPLPGAQYDQYNPSWSNRLFYGGIPDDGTVGLSR